MKKKGGPLKIIGTVLTAAVLLSIMPVVNYTVDPAGLYRSSTEGTLEREVADIMLAGHSAEGLENYDERLVKRLCIYDVGQVDTIVLSSSRGALITKEMAGDDSFFNLAVTGASLRDIIGMYGVYRERGNTAKRVILAIDPWILNSNYDSLRFEMVLNDGYCYCLREIMGYPPEQIDANDIVKPLYLAEGEQTSVTQYPLSYLKELFSVPYFQSSLKLLVQGRSREGVAVVDEQYTTLASLRPDGSYCYPESYRNAGYDEVKALAEDQIRGETPTMVGCANMSEDDPNRQLFFDFIKAMADEGVDVDIVMTPLNPILYDYMRQHEGYAAALGAADFVRECAGEAGCDVVGDFDPLALDAFVVDFYDGYHYRAELVARLLEELEG